MLRTWAVIAAVITFFSLNFSPAFALVKEAAIAPVEEKVEDIDSSAAAEAIKAEIESQQRRMFVLTSGERKALVADRAQRAIDLSIDLYQRTKDPDLKFNLGLKLAQLHIDKANALIIVEEAEYEKNLQVFQRAGATGKPPPPPSHAPARVEEDKAVKILQDVIRVAAGRPVDEALYFLGLIHTNRGEPKKARPYYERVLKEYPRSEYILQAKLMVAESYFEEGNFHQALQYYDELIAAQPTVPFPKYKKAWTLFNLARYPQSINLFMELYQSAKKGLKAGERGALQDIGRQIESDMIVIYAGSLQVDAGIRFFDSLAPQVAAYESQHKMSQVLVNNGQHAMARRVCDHLFKKYPSAPVIPLVILTYLETYKEYVHDFQKYHQSLTSVLDQKLTQFPPARLARMHPRAPQSVAELEQFVAKQAKNLHAQGQRMFREAEEKKPKDARLEASAKAAMASAVRYYEIYQKHFSAMADAALALEMFFYQGELYFQLERYDRAAASYVAAIRRRGDAPTPEQAKMVQDAAYGAVVSYDKILDLKETKSPAKADADDKTFQPIPFSRDESHFLQAATFYLREMKGHAAYQQISYRSAKLYYDHNYFSEAVSLFWETIRINPKTELARFSADLILDSYNAKSDYVGLAAVGDQLWAVPDLGDAAYKSEIRKIISEAKFKNVEQFEAQQDFVGAAQAYAQLSEELGDHMGDAALHNAALNFIKARQWQRAVAAYQQLIERHPESTYRKNALLTVAEFHQYTGEFQKSQDLYIQYARSYKSKDKAYQDVVYQIAFVAETLRDDQTALTYYKAYLEANPKADDRNRIIRSMCEIGGRMGAKHLQDIQKTYAAGASRETRTVCQLEEIRQMMRAGTPIGAKVAPLKAALKQLPVYRREVLAPYFSDRIEAIHQQFTAQRLSDVSPEESGALLQNKMGMLRTMEQLVAETGEFGVVSSVFQALRIQAVSTIDLSEDIMAAPVPPGLSDEDRAVYVAEIAKMADPLRKKGIENLKQLLAQAGELKMISPQLPAAWRQYMLLSGQASRMPPWLTRTDFMPFYLPTSRGPSYENSFFPVVLFEPFAIAQVSASIPNLTGLDEKTRSYYETLVLMGRNDFNSAWAKLIPQIIADPKNPYLLNALAFLKLRTGKPQEAALLLQIAQKVQAENPDVGASVLPVLRINEALAMMHSHDVERGAAILESVIAESKHPLAGVLLGYLAIRNFNFYWARSIFQAMPKTGLQGHDAQYQSLGEGISRWGTGDSDGALKLIRASATRGTRMLQVVALPVTAAIQMEKGGRSAFSETREHISAYRKLGDTHSERKSWVDDIEAELQRLSRELAR